MQFASMVVKKTGLGKASYEVCRRMSVIHFDNQNLDESPQAVSWPIESIVDESRRLKG